jgi:hypothetical protein
MGKKCLSEKLMGVKESKKTTLSRITMFLGEEKDLPMLNGLQSRSVTTLSPAT